ncbi:MAG: 2-hydroxychromene-2-carboxylate isomerase [Parerythrobacter sp.]
MTETVELLFDFVSPNAYLVWKPLKALAARHGTAIKVTPVFLGGMHKLTGNAPPMVRDAEVKGKNAYAMLEMRRFIAKHGLDRFTMNPGFPFKSITLQRMLVAVSQEQRIAMIDALLPPIWERGMDVTDTDEVATALALAGLDADALAAKAQDAAVKQLLADATDDAVARGAFGIPTVWVGDEMFFGKERLAQIDEALDSAA